MGRLREDMAGLEGLRRVQESLIYCDSPGGSEGYLCGRVIVIRMALHPDSYMVLCVCALDSLWRVHSGMYALHIFWKLRGFRSARRLVS